MKTVLTIAGSDCSGGAGIQADLKTMTVHKVYGMSALTALTAQNTLGVHSILEVTPQFLEEQLTSIFEDIFPDAVKIGMVANPRLIEVIVATLKKYKPTQVVVDPVLIATSGAKLSTSPITDILLQELLPLATLITPNLNELASLCKSKDITTPEEMLTYAKILSLKTQTAVLAKGGHLTEEASDLLYFPDQTFYWFKGHRLSTKNTHGTGCTLSSAIASNLALGHDLKESVRLGKAYITRALSKDLQLGHGNGPLNHCC